MEPIIEQRMTDERNAREAEREAKQEQAFVEQCEAAPRDAVGQLYEGKMRPEKKTIPPWYEGQLILTACQELVRYGNTEPFSKLIEKPITCVGTPHVQHDGEKTKAVLLCRIIEEGDAGNKYARNLNARIVQDGGLHRGSGKRAETKRKNDQRDDWILGRLFFWKGFGLGLYGNASTDIYACDVVADELADIDADKCKWTVIRADHIARLCKQHAAAIKAAIEAECLKKGVDVVAIEHAIAAHNLRHEIAGRMLRQDAMSDPEVRRKIKRERRFDVDHVLDDKPSEQIPYRMRRLAVILTRPVPDLKRNPVNPDRV